MSWEPSEDFHAGLTEEILREVRMRNPEGIMNAAHERACFPRGSGDEVFDAATQHAVKRPFRDCLGPPLAEPELDVFVAEVDDAFVRAFADFRDDGLRRLGAVMAAHQDPDSTRLAQAYPEKLGQLRSACRAVVGDSGEFGTLKLIFVRFGRNFRPR